MSTIYSLWLQGYNQAPGQVRTCLDRWRQLNRAYTFRLLDQGDVQRLLKTLPIQTGNITEQSLSDIVRVALLKETGGIWVDATVFPTKPLMDWVEQTIGKAEFFSYRRDLLLEPPKNRPISAWFLYATKGSVIIEKLWKETIRYWSVEHHPMTDSEMNDYYKDPIGFMNLTGEKINPSYPYHWLQHIFDYLIDTDSDFGEVWNLCPYKSMTGPHEMQYWVKEELANSNPGVYLTEEKIKEIMRNSEMQKLNWRMDFPISTMEKYSIPIIHRDESQ